MTSNRVFIRSRLSLMNVDYRFLLQVAFISAWLATSLLAAQGIQYTVQIEATPDQVVAEERVGQLKAQGLEAYWIKSNVPGKGVFFRVRIGRFATKAAARQYGERLRQQGRITDYFVVEYEAPAQSSPQTAPVKPQSSLPFKPILTPNPKETRIASTKPEPKSAEAASPTQAVASPPSLKPLPSPSRIEAEPRLSAPVSGYVRYLDKVVGYSFDHPASWTGGPISAEEAQKQSIDAGATFLSKEDAAFINVIWNNVPEANNPEKYNNDLLVTQVVESMGSGAETQRLKETRRQVLTEGDQIKTFLDLEASFRNATTSEVMDFGGKAVIIRASKGMLLVVVFYFKNGSPNAPLLAETIVRSARAPE